MIGRGAIRNPWLFQQFRQFKRGEPLFVPRGCDVLNYLRDLYETTKPAADFREAAQVQKMKKYTNFIGVGVDAEGRFLHDIRRVTSEREFFAVCEKFMDHADPMPLEPFALQLAERDVMAGEHR
jgi:tRNA-dihydrouridine synthase